MIETFNELEMRESGIVYNSTFEQIKKLHQLDPEKAGELAISAIELVLTGEISSDDVMIDLMLEPMKKVREKNAVKYDLKVEGQKTKKQKEMRLEEIADLLAQGFKQREIGEKLNLSQQTVSYRVGLIRSNYPELLQKNCGFLQKNEIGTKKQKVGTVGTNFVQDAQIVQTVQKHDTDTDTVSDNSNFCFEANASSTKINGGFVF